MHNIMKTTVGLAALAALTGCIENSGSSSGMPTQGEQACLQRTSAETNNGDVVLLRSRAVSGGTEVIVGVGPQRAQWRCVAFSSGGTSRPMSLANEGTL